MAATRVDSGAFPQRLVTDISPRTMIERNGRKSSPVRCGGERQRSPADRQQLPLAGMFSLEPMRKLV
jgi:hypothetical protein